MTTNKGFDSSNENTSESNEPVNTNYDELTGIDTYFSEEKVHIPESSKVNIISVFQYKSYLSFS